MNLAQERKNDHARLALDQQKEVRWNPFDEIRFIHHSLHSVTYDDISLTSHWAGYEHTFPFYINGMTGGSQKTKAYNQQLALLAHETGLAMATGSVSIALSQPDLEDTFTVVRDYNPDGFVMANLGAHHTVENAKRAVDLLKADALQIHLNIPQEVVMPEGDRDFSMWLDNIRDLVEKLQVPVIVKEVGFGMSRETIDLLLSTGVQTIDVSGRGGTNFLAIENDRRRRLDFADLANWGQTTPESLLESLAFQDKATILASGGIRSYQDIVKALSMGAQAVGLSGKFLAMVNELGVDKTVAVVHNWADSIKHLMLMLGAETIEALNQHPIVVSGTLKDWAQARQIDYQSLANR